IAKELGLSKEQEEKLQKALQEVFAQVRAQQGSGSPAALGGGGGGGFQGGGNFNNGQQQAMRNRFENAIASVLTPEQLKNSARCAASVAHRRRPAPARCGLWRMASPSRMTCGWALPMTASPKWRSRISSLATR
ncbi:MAG TPA: hypothetical protein VN755_14135, partial [Steroidobacteraceae bacterium]|nr:hypothetical protein [Steroidobacteraceae bacterium]